MLLIISPSKTLEPSPPVCPSCTLPVFLDEAEVLSTKLKSFSKEQLARLMKLSPQLAELNFERNQSWSRPFTPQNAKPAVYSFSGDVYTSLDAKNFTESELSFAQSHLRILSGFYGVLRPLDLIQPYRLEMGTSLETSKGKNLYQFWGNTITEELNRSFQEQSESELVLINLASNEYFKSIALKKLTPAVITPVFKEKKGDTYKVVAVRAKRARGRMTRYIIKNQIRSPESIKSFSEMGYRYHSKLSKKNEWIFCRNGS
ncbi:MAG: peroxide stress protein YaaA [SAR324 cluster bacterium]|nr:peroxide stress protein YaaA [SAR324 cluster bacterium]